MYSGGMNTENSGIRRFRDDSKYVGATQLFSII